MRFLFVFALLASVLFAQCPDRRSERRAERERQRHEQRHQSGRHFHRHSGSHARRYRYDPVIRRAIPVCPTRIIYVQVRSR